MRASSALAALAGALAIGLGTLSGCSSSDLGVETATYAGEPRDVDGLAVPARATDESVELATPGGFEARFWPGVNLGSTVPGHQPGEVSARADDYARWFAEMHELGVRVVRVYTLLDPSFYSELAAHNEANPEAPLYVVHGIWIPEERFLESQDLYDPEVVSEQRRLTREVHAAVLGNLEVQERRGEADGRWTTDISRWVLAWSFGVELDPVALEASQRANPPAGHDGRFIRTRGGSTSTEAWLAARLDELAALDARAGWSRPITFTNWLTLDPFDHPYEPLADEDLVSLDAMHLEATPRWPGGFFASYHAYPYYPDFLRFTPRYADSADPYATYLAQLRRHHEGQAVMVTEFGVPSSLGSAHRGPLGRDQGDHDEAEALAIDADMMEVIRDEGYAGAFIFEWADEWFKFTWNTIDSEQPADRRQLWRNPLTNEQHFGLIASEATVESQVTIDGDVDEWQEIPSQVLWESEEGIRELRVAHDEAYLYLVMRLQGPEVLERGITVGLDVREGLNGGLPGVAGRPMEGADTVVRVEPGAMNVWRAGWTDELAWQYGVARNYLEDVEPGHVRRGSGSWREPQMILNRPHRIPASGEVREVELMDVGGMELREWEDDSRTLGAATDDGVELRIPWALLGFADPSSRLLTRPRPDGTIATEPLDRERAVEIAAYADDGELLAAADPGYDWEPWQEVRYEERRKKGWDELAAAFARSAAAP